MYIDKPMQGHNLMQAIARVNRVFRDKPGGLIVDYLGIAEDLQKAIHNYTAANGKGSPADLIAQAVDVMLTDYDIVRGFFHRFDYSLFFTGTPLERLNLIPAAMEHILKQQDGKKRYMDAVTRLSKGFALAKNTDAAEQIRDEVAFFQTVRATFVKTSGSREMTQAQMESAVKQIVSRAVISEGIVDLFSKTGLTAPNVAILSDEFLDDMRHMEHRNLAVEVLQKLLQDQIKGRLKSNVIKARSFATLLEDAIRRYQNRSMEPQEIVEELIQLAKEINTAQHHGQELGLNDDETAFYDALAENKSAVDVMGDRQLAVIALELVKSVKANVTVDWTVKQSARAKLRVLVKRILRKYGYPPDLQEVAVDLVLEQAQVLTSQWVL
jgi:type I restriction enzyme R subunit